MNKQQAMTWFDSHFNAGTVTSPALRDIISEMFDSVEPEKFVPTAGLTYQFSDYSDFRKKVELNLTKYDPTDPVMYGTKYLPWKYCRPVPKELRHKYGE